MTSQKKSLGGGIPLASRESQPLSTDQWDIGLRPFKMLSLEPRVS